MSNDSLARLLACEMRHATLSVTEGSFVQREGIAGHTIDVEDSEARTEVTEGAGEEAPRLGLDEGDRRVVGVAEVAETNRILLGNVSEDDNLRERTRS